jgi:EAL domain-containing protein (putative c-di-GMP-specific phosphodiesterase class I)
VRFALDDFGRGNCSLGDLKSLSFAEIKIDRHFARNCGTETGNGNICKTIVNMARNFGSESVAIGVENASEAQALKAMGCTLGQGFFFGAPLPEEQFFKLLCARSEAGGQATGAVKAM